MKQGIGMGAVACAAAIACGSNPTVAQAYDDELQALCTRLEACGSTQTAAQCYQQGQSLPAASNTSPSQCSQSQVDACTSALGPTADCAQILAGQLPLACTSCK